MKNTIDTNETKLFELYPEVMEILLKDHTTGKNIFWATDSYAQRGEGYRYGDEITVERITGENGMVIRPRSVKTKDEQTCRTKGMAEVFTPAWVCNYQNNLIDDAWFGQSGVFNTTDDVHHTWAATVPLKFPEGKNLYNYIDDVRLEITCGEAPYLVSRYDTTTGKPIPIGQRIGLLDRKLWAINCLTPDDSKALAPNERKQLKREWRRKVYRAYQSIYGFEWQGDNLLLAREALFVSFVEYYRVKWNTQKTPEIGALKKVAEIVSWNLWQMDGLTYGIPGFTPTEKEAALFAPDRPQERLCRVMRWRRGSEPLKGEEVIFKDLLNPQKH